MPRRGGSIARASAPRGPEAAAAASLLMLPPPLRPPRRREERARLDFPLAPIGLPVDFCGSGVLGGDGVREDWHG